MLKPCWNCKNGLVATQHPTSFYCEPVFMLHRAAILQSDWCIHTLGFLVGMEEEGVSASLCFLLVERELELLISPSDSEESGCSIAKTRMGTAS